MIVLDTSFIEEDCRLSNITTIKSCRAQVKNIVKDLVLFQNSYPNYLVKYKNQSQFLCFVYSETPVYELGVLFSRN